jgi:hypothetical protein
MRQEYLARGHSSPARPRPAAKRMSNPDAGAAKLTTPLASPSNYFELTFQADAGVAYHLWMRGKAVNNYWGNDSVYVQYSDSVTSAARQPHASARRPRKPSASRTA